MRSSTSSVLRWPQTEEVIAALHAWAENELPRHPETERLGYFGSYARGDASVGSDLDLVIVISATEKPFHSRSRHWSTELLPLPTDVLVYTREEWQRLQERNDRFARTISDEVVWIYP